MASVFCRRACPRRNYVFAAQFIRGSRSLHYTAVVQKKKAQVLDNTIDDAFGDDAFGSAQPMGLDAASLRGSELDELRLEAHLHKKEAHKAKLTTEARAVKFSELYSHLSARIGRRPQIKLPPRNSSWVHLIQLAQAPADLRQVVDLFPHWHEFGRDFGDSISELFVQRCQELKAQELALEVFSNYGKYNLKLNMPAARKLVHSLHMEHSLDKTVQAIALFGVYDLPPISGDLPTSSMVAAACFKEAKINPETAADSLKVGQAMLPVIKELTSEKHNLRKIEGEKPRAWARWSLAKVERALKEGQGGQNFQGAKWLREWRVKHGFELA